MACKRLTVYGSPAAVPELAKLLSDAELASWTRIALEAIPGSEADSALRDACPSLSGKLLVGTINSIGVRRDQAAVEMLTEQLKNAIHKSPWRRPLRWVKSVERMLPPRCVPPWPATLSQSAQRSQPAAYCAPNRLSRRVTRQLAVEIYDQVRNTRSPRTTHRRSHAWCHCSSWCTRHSAADRNAAFAREESCSMSPCKPPAKCPAKNSPQRCSPKSLRRAPNALR